MLSLMHPSYDWEWPALWLQCVMTGKVHLRHGEAREQALEESAVVEARQAAAKLRFCCAGRPDEEDVLPAEGRQQHQPHLWK